MSGERRYYTFIFAPSPKSPLRKISIHHNVLYGAAALVLISITVVSIVSMWIAKQAITIADVSSIKKENYALKVENQSQRLEFDRLSGRVAYIEDQAKRLGQAAGIQRLIDVDRILGVGGPAPPEILEKQTTQLELAMQRLSVEYDLRSVKSCETPKGLPARGYITDRFGTRRNPFGEGGSEFHTGLDIAVGFGSSVRSTADGLVIYAGPRTGYGNVVVIDHGFGMSTRYGHLSSFTVSPGQFVRRGDLIGNAGSTGRSTGPHVHYELRENSTPVDPLRFSTTSGSE